MRPLVIGVLLALLCAGVVPYGSSEEIPFELRPGIFLRLVSPQGPVCTAGFLFSSLDPISDRRNFYLSTAGHCVESIGDPVWAANPDWTPRVLLGAAAYRNLEISHDFALIQIDEALLPFINPAVCHWGGPTGIHQGWTAEAPGIRIQDQVWLRYYAWGGFSGGSPSSRPREGLLYHEGASTFDFLGDTGGGASGSPVLMKADGLAAGLVVASHVSSHLGGPGQARGVILTIEANRAGLELGRDLELMTAPLKVPPRPDAACAGSFYPDWMQDPPDACDAGVFALLPGAKDQCQATVPEEVRDPLVPGDQRE